MKRLNLSGWLGQEKENVLVAVNDSKKLMCYLFITLLFATSGILLADFTYIDDLQRVMIGNKGWDDFSRYTSVFLSTLIHAEGYLGDISPLSQIIALFFMSIASAIILRCVFAQKEVSFWNILAVLPLTISPYFLECLSYKYDSVYMALSVLMSVLPLVWNGRKWYCYLPSVFLATLVVCTTYQAALGIFPMLVACICLREWNNGTKCKPILWFALSSALGYIIGILYFRAFIMNPDLMYASSSMPSIEMLFPTIARNLTDYVAFIYADFKFTWLGLIVGIAGLFVLVQTYQSKQNRVVAMAVHLVAVLMFFVLSFGCYTALLEPTYSPRSLYGFGCFIAVMALGVTTGCKRVFFKIPVFMLCWCLITFCYIYGNALSAQQEYTDFRIEMTLQTLIGEELIAPNKKYILQLDGGIPFDTRVKNSIANYPVLGRLVPIYYQANWFWGEYKIYHYYGMDNVERNYGYDLTTFDLPMVHSSVYQTIYAEDEFILVTLY